MSLDARVARRSVSMKPVAHDGDEQARMWSERRQWMVRTQLEARGIADARVLAAMLEVPREAFVPGDVKERAYADMPLPIGWGATISQPYIVAHMTELARVQPGDRVLEIGTGSGYQAAVLHAMGADVYSIESVPSLAERAGACLEQTGYGSIHVRAGDGYEGWPEAAPFAAIIVTAAPPDVPEALRNQLADGGRLVIPVGGPYFQQLMLMIRSGNTFESHAIEPVAFVPMRRPTQS
jgi:protein-L-isoaspartate(D-aspartate) O-methyltransferase